MLGAGQLLVTGEVARVGAGDNQGDRDQLAAHTCAQITSGRRSGGPTSSRTLSTSNYEEEGVKRIKIVTSSSLCGTSRPRADRS